MFGAREGLSPEKENPLNLMFDVREGLLPERLLPEKMEPSSVLHLE